MRSSHHNLQVRNDKRAGFTLVELLVVITIIGILIALLLPAVQAAREAARQMQCANNFKQVGVGMHNYAAGKGCFPPGQLVAPRGFWGWSVYLLPFIEQQAVYDMITFDFAEDNYSEKNYLAAGKVISAYLCPSDPQAGELVVVSSRSWYTGPTPEDQCGLTNMCAVFDSDAWVDSGCWTYSFPSQVNGMFGRNGVCTLADVRDGTSNTLMVGEVTGAGKGTHFGAHWVGDNGLDTRDGINGPNTIPGGLWGGADPPTITGSFYMGFASFHRGGCNFVLADGSVHFLSQNINQNVLRSLATRDGPSPASNPLHNWQEVIVAGPP